MSDSSYDMLVACSVFMPCRCVTLCWRTRRAVLTSTLRMCL